MHKADGVVRSMALGVLSAVVLTAATRGLADEESPAGGVEFAMNGTWDSRYATEGRDNLDGDALVGTAIETAFKGLCLSAWYASSPDVDYGSSGATPAPFNPNLSLFLAMTPVTFFPLCARLLSVSEHYER